MKIDNQFLNNHPHNMLSPKAFLMPFAETKRYRETLRDFYEANHCDQYDCSGLDGYCTGWDEDRNFHVLEVN